MATQHREALAETSSPLIGRAVFPILAAISFSHLVNDMVQSLIPAIYPLLKTSLGLDFAHIGLITLTYQLTASLLQPVIGLYTDSHPKPFSLGVGMSFTLVGLLMLSAASTFGLVLAAAVLVGLGSAVFHPESSRVARMASGGQHGLAQSLFQVGGNAGTALGPLLAAFIVLPHGQRSIAWFSLAALVGIHRPGSSRHLVQASRPGRSQARDAAGAIRIRRCQPARSRFPWRF